MKTFLIILIFPFFLFSNSSVQFSEIFSAYLHLGKIGDCYRILNEWEFYEPHMQPVIKGLRASVALADGDIRQSTLIMDEALETLKEGYLSYEVADYIKDCYEQAINFNCFETMQKLDIAFRLCGGNQPKGLKIRYWFGIAQILAGCIVASFNPPLATTLISTGIGVTVQAVTEAVDNKEQWEKNLDARRRINIKNLPSWQENTSIVLRKKRTLLV